MKPQFSNSISELFTPFSSSIEGIKLPKKFTFPFRYEPHALSKIAVEELQQRMETSIDWKHNFGLIDDGRISDKGKMFGVLVVQNPAGEVGYLSAFSGKLCHMEPPEGFVPHVFNLPPGFNFFEKGMQEINNVAQSIKDFEKSEAYKHAKENLESKKKDSAQKIEEYQELMRGLKKVRKQKRLNLQSTPSNTETREIENNLIKESLHHKHQLRVLKQQTTQDIEEAQKHFDELDQELKRRVDFRANLSNTLQKKIFEGYQFQNAKGQLKSLNEVFFPDIPPAGAGDCAAPKLMQYAYLNNFKPLAMAEFWWGESPVTVIRKHKSYYPACKGKCKPILTHVLKGLDIETDPGLIYNARTFQVDTVFEDEHLVVINKPNGLLSVPGKASKDSVAEQMKERFPEATGPLVVHRLDQATSGLMLIAKSLEIHKKLQKQFIDRTVKKRYTALIEGIPEEQSGIIDLPLRVDLDNRPNQLVCYEHGKRAITRFEIVDSDEKTSRVHLYPITGRSHQLRMHMSHKLGLNCPIKGDPLYGTNSDRLYLHAEYILFKHPLTGKTLRFTVDADF